MANSIEAPQTPLWVGVDVAKETLDIATDASGTVHTLPNLGRDISQWLKTLHGPVYLAVEATNHYHLELVKRAYQCGVKVYLVDGYRLSKYRESIGGRIKTDPSDARLLRRYVMHEHEDLRLWAPPPKGYDELRRLLLRRGKLVKARTALRQSLAGLPEMKTSVKALMRRMKHVEALIDKRLCKLIEKLGWSDDVARCRRIEGIGPTVGCALTTLYNRGHFASADAFIAFLGMDVRIRQSGKYQGRRKLTKKGDHEMRRLLYMAAMAASRSATWSPYYDRARQRGMTRIQALVALARKLVRVAFSLLKNQSTYEPKNHQEGCAAT